MDVNVNVYDISGGANKYFSWLGLGAFHTGVQIGNREYTFSNAGVIYHTPFEAGEEAVFRETIEMGQVSSMSAVNAAVGELRNAFKQGSYDLTRQNCNHFSNELVKKLLGKSLPGWINRAARLGASAIAPKDTSSSSSSSSSSSGDSASKKDKKKDAADKKKAATERPKLTEKQLKMLEKLKKDKN